MPAFSASWNTTNTASTTIPMGAAFATATSQIAIYEINSGSDATADNAVKYAVRRASARGTSLVAFTPTPQDQNVTQTALTTFDTGWSVLPTVTSASEVLTWAQHQRGTYRWVAYDYPKMLRTQAGTGKGFALMSVVVSGAFNAVFSVAWDE